MPPWSINNRIRPPLLIIAAIEAMILFSSVYVGAYLAFGNVEDCQAALGPLAPKAAMVSGIVLTSMVAMGLYQFHQRLYLHEAIARVCVGLGFGCLVLAAIFYVVPELNITTQVGAIAGAYTLVLLIGTRSYFVRNIDENVFRRRTFIYGAGVRAESIFDLRRRADRRGFRVVGHMAAAGDEVESRAGLIDPGGRTLVELAAEYGADEILVAMDDRRGNLPVRELLDAKLRGIQVIELLEFLERETGKIRIDLVKPGWLIFSPGFRLSRLRILFKRALDLVFSTLILLATWPAMLLIILAIKLEDGLRAPVLYRQCRVGKGGRPFNLLKFRSMSVDAEADGKAVWAARNDSRVTRIGGFLRNSRLDELPQIFNVLSGQMSLVGPRPERPEFVQDLKEEIPYYAERHAVRPGLTGWAQLNYSYGASQEDTVEKLQFDLYYVKNQNLILDVMILLQTVEVVLWGKGAR